MDARQLDGHSFLVPPCRRLPWDLLYFHRAVPLCGHDRKMDLSALADARHTAPRRISWAAIFLRAYGLLAAQQPVLRQTWYRWPVAHIYQHPRSVAILTVQREYRGQPWLFWGRIDAPENLSLIDIQGRIDRYTTEDPAMIFRKQVQFAHLPTVARRMIWGWNLHVAKNKRAKRIGTFFLSTLAGRGAEIQVPPSVQTGCLTYGPPDASAQTRVTLAYDHRLMDGALVADCLADLETILLKQIRCELTAADQRLDGSTDAAA